MATTQTNRAEFTRDQVEDLFYREAELLDAWKLDEWLGLLTDLQAKRC